MKSKSKKVMKSKSKKVVKSKSKKALSKGRRVKAAGQEGLWGAAGRAIGPAGKVYAAGKFGYKIGTALDRATGASTKLSKVAYKKFGPAPKSWIRATDRVQGGVRKVRGAFK